MQIIDKTYNERGLPRPFLMNVQWKCIDNSISISSEMEIRSAKFALTFKHLVGHELGTDFVIDTHSAIMKSNIAE